MPGALLFTHYLEAQHTKVFFTCPGWFGLEQRATRCPRIVASRGRTVMRSLWHEVRALRNCAFSEALSTDRGKQALTDRLRLNPCHV